MSRQSLCSILSTGGNDFVDRELFRGLRDQLMLFAEVFRSEDLFRCCASSSRKLPPVILVFGAADVVAMLLLYTSITKRH